MAKPSEKYVLFQRLFTFLDEWGLYAVLLGLLTAGYYIDTYFLFYGIPVVIYGAICIGYSYKRLWRLEEAMLADDVPVSVSEEGID